MRSIFKIVTLKDNKRIEIKNYDKKDEKELLRFLADQNLYERIFFWMHSMPEDIVKEFDLLIEKGNYIIIAYYDKRIAGLGLSKGYDEYYLRHIEKFYICVDKAFWGTGLIRELISELVFLSLEDGKEKVIIELLPEMRDHKKEIEELNFEQIAVLPEFFMDDKGAKRDIIVFANDLGNLWKSFEENIDIQFKPLMMED